MEVEQETPHEYQGEIQDDEYHPAATQSVEGATNNWVEEPSQYNWDDADQKSDNDDAITYRSSAVCIPSRYGMPICKVYGVRFTPEKKPLRTEGSMQPRMVVAVDKSAEPLYHHRSCYQLPTRPDQPCEENQTISGYWEINGTQAHCLLDSGSEGIMISPDFTCAMGMKTFTLAQPIALQLACIGSHSTIMVLRPPFNLVTRTLKNTSMLPTWSITM